jgi:hypothetical protein
MTAPVIHGKGRLMFARFEIATVDVKSIRQIPGGPPMDEEFIKEGARALQDYRFHDLPYILVSRDYLENCYWVIDGRHRLESYKLAGSHRLNVLVGHGMIALDKV